VSVIRCALCGCRDARLIATVRAAIDRRPVQQATSALCAQGPWTASRCVRSYAMKKLHVALTPCLANGCCDRLMQCGDKGVRACASATLQLLSLSTPSSLVVVVIDLDAAWRSGRVLPTGIELGYGRARGAL
jgi:hypothetical protein